MEIIMVTHEDHQNNVLSFFLLQSYFTTVINQGAQKRRDSIACGLRESAEWSFIKEEVDSINREEQPNHTIYGTAPK